MNEDYPREPHFTRSDQYISLILVHWVPLTTIKKMQKKRLVISGCLFYPNVLILLSMILMQRNLLVIVRYLL